MMSKVWLVTGCSKGLGKTLVKMLLERGYKVVATSRSKNRLIEFFGEESNVFLPVSLDLVNEEDIKQVVKQTIDKFGRIDVLVNNAGYLQFGAVEDEKDNEVRDAFDINYFGTLNMCRNIIPHMRKQKSGHILNTSSIAGFTVNNLGQTYSGTKFALNALSYALAAQLKIFNIRVTNLVLGYFRTDFLSEESIRLSQGQDSAYEKLFNKHHQFIKERNQQQLGDPIKACEAYIKVVEMDEPPTELLLGSDSYDIVKNVLITKLNDIDKNIYITKSTDLL